MLDAMGFVTTCMLLAELELKRSKYLAAIEEYVKENGNQDIGPVHCKVSTPRRKLDYQATWEKYGYATEIDIEDFLVVPDPIPQPAAYYDYKAACKEAGLKNIVCANEDQLNIKTVKVVIDDPEK